MSRFARNSAHSRSFGTNYFGTLPPSDLPSGLGREDGSLEAGADVGRGHLVAGLLMGPGDLVGPAAVEHVVDDAGVPAVAVCKRMYECLRAARREESAYSSFFWTATKTHLFSAPGRLF